MPHRRRVLAMVGTTLVSAGCAAPTSDEPGGDEPATDTPTGTPADGTPAPPRNRFRDAPCPTFDDADRTVCWHTHPDAAVSLAPSAPVFRPVGGNDTVETITFTLHNGSDGIVSFDPAAWAIKREEADGWTHVAPASVDTESLYELEAGQSYRWVVSRTTHPTPNAKRTTYPTVELENGRHAFVLTGTLSGDATGSGTADGNGARTVEWVALFDVRRVYV
ncbi:MAG: hypothetical protein ABEI80_00840 [Haloplanus sp.]